MTAAIIEKLRKSRGEHTWLEDLRANSTEAFIEEIRSGLRDPEWDFGPAELVSCYLTGDQPHVLAEKASGQVIRVYVEGKSTKWNFSKVELRDTPDSIPTIDEEVLESARLIVDHILDEDVVVNIDETLEAITEAVYKNKDLPRNLKIESLIQDLDSDSIWYLGQIPESISTTLSEDSSIDECLVAIKGRLASVAEMLREDEDIEVGLRVVVESVLEDSEKAVILLKSCLDLEEGSGHHRKVSKVLSVVPEIHKALGFIQKELGDRAKDAGG